MRTPEPLVAVVGMTASGKSDLALDLADALGGPDAVEIVGADAMQLYRGMDIGTAKVPPEQRRGIAHHQLDVLDVTEEAAVAAYQRHARADVAAIRDRGRTPILAGGSALYVRAVLDRLEFPATDPSVRAELEDRADRLGARHLHDELAVRDPAAASRIDPRNTRRVIRALEVVRVTGRPYAASMPEQVYVTPTIQMAIDIPRDQLDARIGARARTMMDGGLLEETERLLQAGLARGATASRAVGYAQAQDVLAGRMSASEAVESVARATRQLARRQEKWFRRDPRIHWLPGGEDVDPADTLAAALRTLRA
ncbi:tRNA (adenosine(37)-N6)-dimethylallyltransferase MiaA [Georgenia alba]|uniref:tRNA dimethylallyltransferase n=1 Tax=Georgenia alba TaxID=2233858 RepID=A0ABW2Q759_9MICO